MYESPIDMICREVQYNMQEQIEGAAISAVQSCGINVKKEELIKALNYDRQQYEKGYADAKAEQQWISVEERLPEENGRYLVTRGLNACGSLWNRIYIANYSDLMGIKSERIWWQGNVGKPDFERLDDVLAWLPLPAPYREDEA